MRSGQHSHSQFMGDPDHESAPPALLDHLLGEVPPLHYPGPEPGIPIQTGVLMQSSLTKSWVEM